MAFEEFTRYIADRGVLQTLGQEIAKGMAKSGNASSFSSFNPTGDPAIGRGRAGGRGDTSISLKEQRKSQLDEIRSRQAHSKYTNQLSKSFVELHKELRSGEKDMKHARRRTIAFANVFEEQWGKAMDKVFASKKSEDKLVKRLNSLLEEEIKDMNAVNKIRQRQKRLENIILNKRGGASQSVIDEYNRVSEALSKSTQGIDSWTSSLGKSAKSSIRAFFSVEAAMASLVFAVKQLYGDYKSQLKYGSQFTSMYKQQVAAMMSGIDPGVMAELMAETRQTSLTFGSLDEYMQVTKKEQELYYNQIADLTESFKFITQMNSLLGKSGISASKTLGGLGDSFRLLNEIAGITSTEMTQMVQQMLADEDVQKRLRVAKQGERRAIIEGIQKQVELNIVMGLTKEQALAAALAMGKMSGGGIKERYKRAAMLQMAFTAMGVAGGAEMAQLERKGTARHSPRERERYEELGTAFAQAATAAQAGTHQLEFMRDIIMEKGGLEAQYGPGSALNKQLAEGLKANRDVLQDIRDGIEDAPQRHHEAMMAWDKFTNAIQNSGIAKLGNFMVQIAGMVMLARFGGGAVKSLLRIFGKGGFGKIMSKGGMGGMGGGMGMMSNIFGRSGQMNLPLGPPGGPSMMGRTASMLGKGAKFGARALPGIGSAMMVGKDLYDLSQGDTSKANTGALIGSVVGGALGLVGGPMGVAIGAGLGNMAGEFIGGQFDDPEHPQTLLANNTAELVDPAKRTATGIENLIAINIQQKELAEIRVQQSADMISGAEARARLAALNDTAQYQGWSKADA